MKYLDRVQSKHHPISNLQPRKTVETIAHSIKHEIVSDKLKAEHTEFHSYHDAQKQQA